MKIMLELSNDEELISGLMLDKRMPEDSIVHDRATFRVDKGFDYLIAHDLDEPAIVGMIRARALSVRTLEAHMQVLPQFWATAASTLMADELKNDIIAHTQYSHVFTHVPEICKEVMGFLYRYGFKLCGSIKRGAQYQGKICDLMLFEYEVKRG